MAIWRASVLSLVAILSGCDGPATVPEGDAATTPTGPDPSAHCPEREPIDCAEDIGGWIPQRLLGDTLEGDDGYSGSRCGVGGGVAVEDAAYRFTAPAAGFYRFSTEGSSFDTVISIRGGSCAAREVTCNDDALDGVSYSALTLELAECETITVVIDGAEVDGGPYVLAVGASEHACFDGADDDGDGLVDCDDPDCAGPRCDVASGDWPEDWAVFERGVLDAVNEQRAMGAICDGEEMPPVGPLERDVLLEEAARRHSLDMAENGYFSHTSLDGREPSDRIRDAGFEGSFVGENIARGASSVDAVMAGWMASPGHCRNIMNPSWDLLGVGYANPDGSSGGPFWTQNFAARP